MPQYRAQFAIYAIGVLLIVDFIFFGYMPSQRRLGGLQVLQAQQEATIQQTRQESMQLAALRTTLKQSRQVGSTYARIPVERELGQFLQEVMLLMDRHQLSEQCIEPGLDSSDSTPIQVPLTLRCRGAFRELFAFYRDLQQMPRLVCFEEVLFERHPRVAHQIQMVARVAIYYEGQSTYENEPNEPFDSRIAS